MGVPTGKSAEFCTETGESSHPPILDPAFRSSNDRPRPRILAYDKRRRCDKIDQRGEHILLANSRIPDNPHGFQRGCARKRYRVDHPLAGTPYVPQYSRHDP